MAEQDADTPEPPDRGDTPAAADAAAGGSAASDPLFSRSFTPRLPRDFGPFRLLDELGRGGMGVVYRARDTGLDREVALKVIRGSAVNSPERRARFLREASAMARLRHPGIVEVYAINTVDEQPYFTMRLIRGHTLADRVERGPLPVDEAARIGVTLARVLAFAHAAGIVHRDVKPGNVMLEEGVNPVLLDFGLVQEPDAEQTRYTRDSQLLGTPMYMAPELALQGPRVAGPASDQYALALMIWEMMAGFHPFRAPTQLAVLRRAINEEAPSLQLYGVPAAVDQVIQRALSRDPALRYPDLGAMADALEQALRAPEAPQPTPDPPEPPPKAAPRRLWRYAALLAAIAVFALPRTSAWESWRREARAQEHWTRARAEIAAQLSHGKWAEAEELFVAFTASGESRDSAAEGQAWTWWAEQLDASGREDDAVFARVNAYARADARDLAAIVVPLARTLERASEWEKLAGLVAVMADRAPEVLLLPEMATSRAEVQALLGDIRGATPGLPPELQRLGAALSGATPTALRPTRLIPWRYSADEPPGLLSWSVDSPERVVVDARLQPLLRFTSAAYHISPVVVRGGAGPELLVDAVADGECKLSEVEGEQLRTRFAFACESPHAAMRASDGSVLLADNRTLWALTQRGDTWERHGAERSLNYSNSEVRDLESADTDGDGQPETWVAVSGWGAYDMRVIEPRGGDFGVRARRRIGEMLKVSALQYQGRPAIAAIQGHDPRKPLNYLTFGPNLPHGDTRGIHILRLEGEQITRLAEVPILPIELSMRGQTQDQVANFAFAEMVGDVDGDGLDDIVTGILDTWTYIFVQKPGGGFARMTLAGWVPLALTQADEDPALEIAVRRNGADTGAYILGAGAGDLPSFDLHPLQAKPPPDFASAAARERWGRAADLVRMGFTELAAGRLEDLARASAGDPVEPAALIEAARLYEQANQQDKSVELVARVANLPGAGPETLEAAMDAFLSTRRLDRALVFARDRMALPDPPERVRQIRDRLEADLGGPTRVIDFRTAELPPVEVRDALALLPDVTLSALRTRASGPGGEMWRAPVRNAGGLVRVEVRATVGRLDWGTAVALELSPSPRRFENNVFLWASGGGGGMLNYRLMCPGQLSGFRFTREELEGLELTLRFEYDPRDGLASCALLHGDRELGYEVYIRTRGLDPTFNLIFRAESTIPGIAEVALHEIRMQGLEPLPVVEDEVARAHRLAMRGSFEEALATFAALLHPSDADLLTQISLNDALGRIPARDAALAALFRADPEAQLGFARALLLMPDRVLPWLRARLGDRAYILLFDNYDTMATMHEDRADVQVALTSALDGIDRVSIAGLSEDEQPRLVRAVGRAGGAWRRLGRLATAARYLERACALADEARPGLPEGDNRDALDQGYAWAAREMAALLLTGGDPEGAMQWLLRGLERSPAPELYGDQCEIRADLAALRSHPGWMRLRQASHRP